MRTKSARVIAALAICIGLAGCSSARNAAVPDSQSGSGTASSPSPTPTSAFASEAKCPDKLKSSFDYNGPNTEADFSVIAAAFGVELPSGGCVILTSGNSINQTHFEMFWPGKDQNFANTLGNSLVAAGGTAYGDPIDYRKGDADIVLWAYPAGDGMHWSDDFEGSPQLVVGEGDIHTPS